MAQAHAAHRTLNKVCTASGAAAGTLGRIARPRLGSAYFCMWAGAPLSFPGGSPPRPPLPQAGLGGGAQAGNPAAPPGLQRSAKCATGLA